MLARLGMARLARHLRIGGAIPVDAVCLTNIKIPRLERYKGRDRERFVEREREN